MTKVKEKLSLTEGPIFTRMLLFVIPIVLTGILQVMYNMADNIVVGQFSGDPDALAAVGSTGSLTTLIVNFTMGLAAGAGIVIAQSFGARDYDRVSRISHTTVAFSAIAGIVFMSVALLIARPMLSIMGTKPEIYDKAVLYMSIICLGIPATSVYNFGASILRSTGDSKTSLYILSVSGLINVGLNFFFVLVCNMDVDGVATATIISQYVSAVWVVLVLIKRREECYGISVRRLRLDRSIVGRIFRFGLPISIQGSLFSISNIIITSAVNTFPTTTVSAKAIATNIESVTYTSMNAFSHAAMTFIGQNYGAKKCTRLNRIFIYSLLQVAMVGILIGQIEILFERELALLYLDAADPNKEIILSTVSEINRVMLNTYFIGGIMEVLSGILKGLGFSISSMAASLIGLSVRVLWVLFVTPLPKFHTMDGLFVSYVISWTLTILISLIMCAYAWRKLGIWRGARLEKSLKEN